MDGPTAGHAGAQTRGGVTGREKLPAVSSLGVLGALGEKILSSRPAAQRSFLVADDRLHDGQLEVIAQLTARFEIRHLRHEDGDDLLLRVDKEVRVVRATPAVAAFR